MPNAWPLLHRSSHHGGRAAPRRRALGSTGAAAGHEGAGIRRLGDDATNDTVRGLAPTPGAGRRGATVAPREQDGMLLAVAQAPIAWPELLKLAQHPLNPLLDLRVGILDDAVIR
jgi:hypothetical protein